MPNSTPTTSHAVGMQQATSSQRTQKPTSMAQRSIPGGDKEFRDTIRRRQSPPNAPTFRRDMPTNVSNSPRLSRNRDISPKTNDPWCAWCTENGRSHNHSTANCSMLKNANAQDQWTVINKHRVCDSCLPQGHHWKVCPNKFQHSCPECGNSHHPNLGCLPAKQPYTYPNVG